MKPEDHPNIKLIKSALNNGLTDRQKLDFNNWREGTKIAAEPELKKLADQLWIEYESKKRQKPTQLQSVQARAPQGGRPSGFQGGGNGGGQQGGGPRHPAGGGDGPNARGASAKVFGEEFHNPYTFLSFGENPARQAPTLRSVDDLNTSAMQPDAQRHTGILELQIRTLSPLVTCEAEASSEKGGHKIYKALTLGDDVIMPASGIRGALRNLMTILSGSPLSYVDEEVWLCQGRDKNLGPAGKNSSENTPRNVFLARVIKEGSHRESGTVELGETRLKAYEDLESLARKASLSLSRPSGAHRGSKVYVSDSDLSMSETSGTPHPWEVKLSGRPINSKGKREGLFKGNNKTIELPAGLWAAYMGRNRHGQFPALKQGDLVWLEAKGSEIQKPEDVAGLHMARWTREGERLLELITSKHKSMLPDSLNNDGKVAIVSDMFGHVPLEDLAKEVSQPKGQLAPHFAARLRPENLVFKGASKTGLTKAVALAPLSAPHPGCAAFYRNNTKADRVANNKERGALRGYKVYRTSKEQGTGAPWLYEQQGVFDDKANPKNPEQNVNKTVDLLKAQSRGTLRIACRGLSADEMLLLLGACTVDWRLGGGKPLGLGHVQVVGLRFWDEDGEDQFLALSRPEGGPLALPEVWAQKLLNNAGLQKRLKLWQASQNPVARLSYPRAVSENRNKLDRGGHVWFGRHANPRKIMDTDNHPKGLEVIYVEGELKRSADNRDCIAAQVLPMFDGENPQADVLYGYDVFLGDGPEWKQISNNRQTSFKKAEKFDRNIHASNKHQSGGNQSSNRETRQEGRRDR